jgi:ribosomal protein S18 acetylase RimI-like enzyme
MFRAPALEAGFLLPVSRIFDRKETAMPSEQIVIRRATAEDSEAVYEIVLRAVRETIARDYPASVIDRLVLVLPDKVASNLDGWHAFVAIADGRVIGTGSLSGQTVTSVYVHPDYQRRGVATKLMDAVENTATAQSVRTLSVQSSVTAQALYTKRGFKIAQEGLYGEERIILMSKDIPAPQE